MSEREAVITYWSCNIVLEVNVAIEGFDTRRDTVLALLPPELANDHDAAERHVLPFVAAVQHGDARAIAEVARVLNAQNDPERMVGESVYYDPTKYDGHHRLLCRIGGCGMAVMPPGSTHCPEHAEIWE